MKTIIHNISFGRKGWFLIFCLNVLEQTMPNPLQYAVCDVPVTHISCSLSPSKQFPRDNKHSEWIKSEICKAKCMAVLSKRNEEWLSIKKNGRLNDNCFRGTMNNSDANSPAWNCFKRKRQENILRENLGRYADENHKESMCSLMSQKVN